MSLPRGGGEQRSTSSSLRYLGSDWRFGRSIASDGLSGRKPSANRNWNSWRNAETARGSSGRHPRLGLRMHVLTQAVAVGGEEIPAEHAGVLEEAKEVPTVGVERIARRASFSHQHL